MSEILNLVKQTDNKYRWDADIDGTLFEFYIPKNNVPEPVPTQIRVHLKFTSDEEHFSPATLRAKVRINQPHTQTIRYTPVGNPKEWLIGEPYIPVSLLPDETPEMVYVKVEWL